KLYNSSGRDLRRALFSLKQIFQDDKDLVHEFVVAEGLTCLIKVGAEADQNYQNYILRGVKPWSNIMEILEEKDGVDTELLVYAMTLVNKTLSGLPDQDSFYDVVDCLEELGIAAVSQRHLNKKGTDLDLVEQLNIYEVTAGTFLMASCSLSEAEVNTIETGGSECGVAASTTPGSLQNCVLSFSASWSVVLCFVFLLHLPVCHAYLAFPSRVCAFLFSPPCLREEEKEEEERPVTEPDSEEEREDDAPCQGKDSREARPASEQSPAGKDAAPESSALSSATSQGKQLLASTAVGSPLRSGSSGAALLSPPLTPASASRPSSTAPEPPKTSPTIEKLPYVPHSPFHLFSYDFEDSPLSAKEKEAESPKESSPSDSLHLGTYSASEPYNFRSFSSNRYNSLGNTSYHSRPSGSAVPATPTPSLSPPQEARLERTYQKRKELHGSMEGM
ncbi:FH1/FH2 domain-containing protein 3-like, partial [Leptonychotes weddellii]|uniref:FH1/FH2 domain-containing protein 3-like n=1 Tax=Leptonychotes weddellii TaxID=9713 RepID=A0A7F8QAU9_LEPWE